LTGQALARILAASPLPAKSALNGSLSFAGRPPEDVMSNHAAARRPDSRLAAVCGGCSCLCDDILVQPQGGRIGAVERACTLGQTWFNRAATDESGPECHVAGQAVDLAAALSRAADILRAARYPLVYGLEGEAGRGQRAAVALAERLGGALDTATSSSHAASILATQEVGKSTCTLGEIRNRCDLIVCFGADPQTTHPRLLSHYSLEPAGLFVPRGRADRTLIVVDARPTPTAELADQFLPLESEAFFAALWTLRALVRGRSLDPRRVAEQTGHDLDQWRRLAERMQEARYGSLLYGPTLMAGPTGAHQAAAVLALVRDLNAHTRFVGRSLRGPHNASGADQVLLWRTGYAYAVDFARGYPRFGPGEYTAAALLRRGEPDAALVVASDPLVELEPQAASELRRLPLVYVGPPGTATWSGATVGLATSISGIHTGGVAYRMDEVPVPLVPVLESRRPSGGEILRRLEGLVRIV
jgi:formylmethanofuran dehydrogenase subunit B